MASKRVARHRRWRRKQWQKRYRSCAVARRWRLKNLEAAVQRLRRQQHDEGQALQDQNGGIWEIHAPLDEAARRDDAAEPDRDWNDRDRVVPRQERYKDAGETIACDQR